MSKRGDWEDKWEDIVDLGQGGQGITVKVKAKQSDAKIGVLKKLKNNKSLQARRRMYQEVANLRIVANAGGRVPRVFDDNTACFEDESVKLYFVMEFINETTLDQYVQENYPLDVDTALQFTLDVCHTIGIGHDQDIIHRDLKPKNLILTKCDGGVQATILDYGISFNASSRACKKSCVSLGK